MIGGLNNGWAAANTTLTNERAGLGSGGGSAAGGGVANPGTVMGMVSRRAGDLIRRPGEPPPPSGSPRRATSAGPWVAGPGC